MRVLKRCGGRGASAMLAGTMLAATLASGASAATYIWSGGTYSAGVTSPSPLASPDILSIQSGANKFFTSDFTNASGQVNWVAGDIYFGSGAIVTNDSLWTTAADGGFYNSAGSGTFANTGVFRKDGGTGTSNINIAFVNSGTIDAVTGTIRFAGGGQVFDSGTSFTGAGTTQIAGNAAFNGAIGSQNLDFTSGVYTGTGASLSGTADFIAGTFAGDWTISAGTTLNGTGGGNKFIAGGFTNAGTVDWAQGDIYLMSGAGVVNDGSWLVGTDSGFYVGAGSGTFTNNGVFRKDGGTGTTNVNVPFVNNGTIDTQTGIVRFSGGGQVFNGGSSFTGAGTTQIAGNAAFNGTVSSQNLDFTSGVYTGTVATLSGAADFLAGTFAGDWTVASGATLTATGGGNKFIAAGFTNDGGVNWQQGDLYLTSGATIGNNGGWVIGGDSGIYPGAGGGTFSNDGLFRKDGGVGTSNINIAFVNSGTVDAATGIIRFAGSGLVFNDGSSFTGAGTTQIAANAAFNGGISSGNLDFVNGAYAGTGAALSGTADFVAGTFTGDWTVVSGAVLTATGGGNKFIAGTFANQGTVDWAQGDIYLQSGAVVTNGGDWIATGNNGFYQGSGGGSFVNEGLFQKTGGTGNTVFAVPLTNAGTIDVQSGTIVLPAAFVNGGSLTGTSTFSLSGTLTNAGTVAPGAEGTGIGTLTLNGNYVQTAAGLFSIQLGAGGIADLFLISGTASLDGTLGLSCVACVLNAGDIYTLLDASGNLSGVFANVTTSGFAAGFAYSLLYDSVLDRVQLRIDDAGQNPPNPGVPEPASWAMMILGFGAIGAAMRRRRRPVVSA